MQDEMIRLQDMQSRTLSANESKLYSELIVESYLYFAKLRLFKKHLKMRNEVITSLELA